MARWAQPRRRGNAIRGGTMVVASFFSQHYGYAGLLVAAVGPGQQLRHSLVQFAFAGPSVRAENLFSLGFISATLAAELQTRLKPARMPKYVTGVTCDFSRGNVWSAPGPYGATFSYHEGLRSHMVHLDRAGAERVRKRRHCWPEGILFFWPHNASQRRAGRHGAPGSFGLRRPVPGHRRQSFRLAAGRPLTFGFPMSCRSTNDMS